MEQIGQLAPILVFAFAFGWVWHHILKGADIHWLQMLPYPVLGVVLGEGFWATNLAAGPEVLGVHIAVALPATLLAVGLKTLVETYRQSKGFRINLSLGDRNRIASEQDAVQSQQ